MPAQPARQGAAQAAAADADRAAEQVTLVVQGMAQELTGSRVTMV